MNSYLKPDDIIRVSSINIANLHRVQKLWWVHIEPGEYADQNFIMKGIIVMTSADNNQHNCETEEEERDTGACMAEKGEKGKLKGCLQPPLVEVVH